LKYTRLTLAALLAVTIALPSLAKKSESDLPPQLAVGAVAPKFTLPNTIDGKPVSLESFKGKSAGVCVVFFANHCPVAKAYEERIIALAKEFQPKGVQFMLISSNDTSFVPGDGPADMKQLALDHKYPFPYLYDESQATGMAFGARVTPHIFLLDKDLVLRYRGAVDDNMDPTLVKETYLRNALTALANGKPGDIAVAETVAKGCSIKWKE